jgi:ferritin-like metal-binding protein YciE
MAARSLTDEAINALKDVNRAERAYAKAQKAQADKAEIDRRKEKVNAAATRTGV